MQERLKIVFIGSSKNDEFHKVYKTLRICLFLLIFA